MRRYSALTGDGTFTYTYNAAGRLVQAESVTSTLVYTYTAGGLRVGQSVDGNESTFAWDWASGLPEMLRQGDTLYLVGHETLGRFADGVWQYHLPDALGSVRQATDATGAVTAARAWTPYGVEVGGAQAGLGYTGEWGDTALGMTYLRARWYDGNAGRFPSRDPFPGFRTQPLSLNPYIYVLATPTGHTDPTGRWAIVSPGWIERSVYETTHDPRLICEPGMQTFDRKQMLTGRWLRAAVQNVDGLNELRDNVDWNVAFERLYPQVFQLAMLKIERLGVDLCLLIEPEELYKAKEAAHMSLIVLAERAWTNVADLSAAFPEFPVAYGYEGSKADDTAHFFMHAFTSFESLYADQHASLESGHKHWSSHPLTSMQSEIQYYVSHEPPGWVGYLSGTSRPRQTLAEIWLQHECFSENSGYIKHMFEQLETQTPSLSSSEEQALQFAFWQGLDIEIYTALPGQLADPFIIYPGIPVFPVPPGHWLAADTMSDITTDFLGGLAGIYLYRSPQAGQLPLLP